MDCPRWIIAVTLLGLTGCQTIQHARWEEAAPQFAASDSTALAPLLAVDEAPPVMPVVYAEEEPSLEPEPRLSPTPDAPMTLADLEGVALQNNPTLSAAIARTSAALGRQRQASRYPNPVIGYHATETGNLGTAGQQGGFVSQRVVTAGKLRLDQAIAAKATDEAHFRFHAQEQRVLNDVRVRFYEALVAQRRVTLAEELADVGDNIVKSTRTLLDGGLATENDLLQAKIKADESHILRDNARNQNVEAWRRLAAVAGVPTLTLSPLAGQLDDDLPELDWDEAHALLLALHPELKAAQIRVERAGIAIERARREPIPNVDLSVSYRHHNVTRDDVANVQVGIPIPIFNKNDGNIRAAEAEWIVAGDEAARLELHLLDQLAVAFRKYANARERVDRYRERMAPNAKQSLDLVINGYKNGQVDYLTLLTTQQTYVRINLAYLDALRELRTSAAVIEGQLLTGSLQRESK